MTLSLKLKYNDNIMFHNEADRASTIEELNQSAGLKYLLSKEIEYLKRELARELIKDAKIIIDKDYDGGYILRIEA